MTNVVLPVLSMRMKAFGANWPSGPAGCPGSLTAAPSGHWKASARPPARPLCRTVRREKAVYFDDMTASSRFARGALDGFANAHIGAATADIARHRCVDIAVVGVRIPGKQGRRRHDLARLAIAALNDFKIQPGFLHFGARFRCAHAFDGGNRPPSD